MLQQIVGIAHVVLSFILSIYFLWAPAKYDYFYLLYFLVLNISWTLFKNECALSYLFKIIDNPEYQMGTTTEVSDYDSVLGSKFSDIFLQYILFMYIVNLFIVGNRFFGARNKILILLTGISYIFYTLMLRKVQNKNQKNTLQSIHGFINTLVLGYFVLHE